LLNPEHVTVPGHPLDGHVPLRAWAAAQLSKTISIAVALQRQLDAWPFVLTIHVTARSTLAQSTGQLPSDTARLESTSTLLSFRHPRTWATLLHLLNSSGKLSTRQSDTSWTNGLVSATRLFDIALNVTFVGNLSARSVDIVPSRTIPLIIVLRQRDIPPSHVQRDARPLVPRTVQVSEPRQLVGHCSLSFI
jgi:hypothetical protein